MLGESFPAVGQTSTIWYSHLVIHDEKGPETSQTAALKLKQHCLVDSLPWYPSSGDLPSQTHCGGLDREEALFRGLRLKCQRLSRVWRPTQHGRISLYYITTIACPEVQTKWNWQLKWTGKGISKIGEFTSPLWRILSLLRHDAMAEIERLYSESPMTHMQQTRVLVKIRCLGVVGPQRCWNTVC